MGHWRPPSPIPYLYFYCTSRRRFLSYELHLMITPIPTRNLSLFCLLGHVLPEQKWANGGHRTHVMSPLSTENYINTLTWFQLTRILTCVRRLCHFSRGIEGVKETIWFSQSKQTAMFSWWTTYKQDGKELTEWIKCNKPRQKKVVIFQQVALGYIRLMTVLVWFPENTGTRMLNRRRFCSRLP